MNNTYSRIRTRRQGTFASGYPTVDVTGTYRQYNPDGDVRVTSRPNYSAQWGFFEYMADSTHPEYTIKKSGKKSRPGCAYGDAVRDVGGPMTHYRVKDESFLQCIGDYDLTENGNWRYRYQGGFIPLWPALVLGGYTWSNDAITTAGRSGLLSGLTGDASSQGARYWHKMVPKTSLANLGQALAESGEFVPMLKTTFRGFRELFNSLFGYYSPWSMSRKVSNQWVNSQFGWRPFINDLTSALQAYCDAEAKLKALRIGNNRWHRRRTRVDSEVLDTAASIGTGSYFPNKYQCPRVLGIGRTVISGVITQDTWSVGAFKYFIPSLNFPETGVQRALNYLRLYGVNINPLLLWNLIPWSWLIDWSSNVGDIIANWSAWFDINLAGRYAYIMRDVSAVFTNSSQIAVTNGYANEYDLISTSWKRSFTINTRRQASPYGFAIDWPDFTAKQWSILGALGLMKVH